jgi:Lysozyme like domain
VAVTKRSPKAPRLRPLAKASSDPRHPWGPPNVLSGAAVLRLATAAGFSSRPPIIRGPSPAGGNYSDAAIAVAIASAESGLDASVVNPASGATGLWQIHGPGQPHTGTRALINPQANAIAAHAKKIAQGWGAWSTYSSGAYKSYLGSATSKPGAIKSHGTIANPLDTLGQIFGKVLPILKITAGGAGLLFTGAALVFVATRGSSTGQAIGQAASLVPNPVAQGAAFALKGGQRGIERREARSYARSERDRIRTTSAREAGRARVVTEGSPGGRQRVRVTSRRATRGAIAAGASTRSAPRYAPRTIEGVRRRRGTRSIAGHGAA